MIPLNHNYSRVTLIRLSIFLLFGLWILNSCKNDIETINALTSELNLPDLAGYNFEITYTDSGILQARIVTPEVNQFVRNEEPYYEFPKGIKATMYDNAGNAVSSIQANYAINYYEKQLWEARNQVLAENPSKGEKLETEQMFWDQKDKRIYSDKFSRMTNPDGVFIGENGFESNQSLTRWWMKGYSGRINVRDDQPVVKQSL